SVPCGRAITCTLCTSPTVRAAAAPASTAARTEPTSPCTKTEQRPLPILFQPTNSTLAAFSIASVAWTSATRPFVSIIPIASFAISGSPIPCYFNMLSTRASWGRAITCDDTSSPTTLAAAAPASTAARTLPTSPRTIAVTYPPPICTVFTSSTLAALTIASHASTRPTRPRVSINPIASLIRSPLLRGCGFSGCGLLLLHYKGRQFVMRAGDHLNADHLANPGCCLRACVSGSFHRGHVPFNEGGHQSGTYGLPAGKSHV